jgi:hypothetical protein
VVGLLAALDAAIAIAIRASGCPRCGSVLHAAHYQRKPRGHAEPLAAQSTLRLSWCCARVDCRRRLTTPSVRFWGALVYTGPVVMAVIGVPPRSPEEHSLQQDAGCSRQSMTRWRRRWVDVWTTEIGRVVVRTHRVTPPERRLLRTLLARWRRRWPVLVALWHLLIHPLTGGRRWRDDGQRYGPLDPQKMELEGLLEALHTPPGAL